MLYNLVFNNGYTLFSKINFSAKIKRIILSHELGEI
jgi:hypothetical protein